MWRSAGVALCTLVIVAGACAAPPAPASAPGAAPAVRGGGIDYVALGDSWTSGPLLPEMTGDPIDCGRSAVNYPSLVAAELRVASFVDASCG